MLEPSRNREIYLKIQPADFAALRAAVQKVLTANPGSRADYTARRLSAERFRWDVLHASGYSTAPLYRYLTDAQIDTALRAIVGES